MKSLLIALIHNKSEMQVDFVRSLFGLYENAKKHFKVHLQIINASFICHMRNLAVEIAQQNKIDYIFFVDTDHIYPKDTIERLYSRKKDIIGGKYFRRKNPHYPAHFKKINYKDLGKKSNAEYFEENKLKVVQASGFAGVLIKTKVFNQLKYPYFKVKYRKNGCVGEDIYFCSKIKNKFKFWIDPTIEYPHLHQIAITSKGIQEIM